MTIKGKAYIAGIYEHPTRHAPDKSTAQLHAEVAKGALEDAGLTKDDIDGYFCAGDAPGGVMAMADYLGLKLKHLDSTDTGGCSYIIALGDVGFSLDGQTRLSAGVSCQRNISPVREGMASGLSFASRTWPLAAFYSAAICGATIGGGLTRSLASCSYRAFASMTDFSFTGP